MARRAHWARSHLTLERKHFDTSGATSEGSRPRVSGR